MTRMVGMDPDRVLALADQLAHQRASLEEAARLADTAAWASLNPVSYAIQPGGLIIAPWAIVGTQVAAARVREAAHEAAALASRLAFEALQQTEVSSAGGTAAFTSPAFRKALLEAVIGDPTLVGDMSPEQLAAWWNALPGEERARLDPEALLIIGNTEGIAYAIRDEANRRALEAKLADPSVRGSERDALQAVRDAHDFAEDSGDVVQLVLLDFPAGADPRAAIAFGDLDTADSIGILVPGMDNTVSKDMTQLTTAARNLYESQKDLIARSDGGADPAVIAWMGYQTPGAAPDTAVLGEGRARDGAVHLTGTLGGIEAVRGDDPRVTIFAHSYGSRVATYSLSTGASADALVMFASPGVAEPVSSVADLNVTPGQVFVTRADKDHIAPIGLFGSGNLDPLDTAFGAEQFSSERHDTLEDVDDHGMLLDSSSNGEKQGYLDRGTNSLDQMARVGVGS